MAYLINNYDGSPLVNVQDRTLNINTTSLKLPGRDYRPYGETMVENLIYMLQNFAQGVPPQNPIMGQIWFDTSLKQIRVYDAATLNWIPVGSPQSGNSFPAQGTSGQIFYHTVKRQIFVWDPNAVPPAPNWRLVGPMGAFDNTDPQSPPSPLPTHSAWEVVQILDTSATPRTVWRLTIAGTLVAIVSQNSFFAGITGFNDPIQPGINLRNSFNLVGTASRALVSDNSQTLESLPASRFMRKDANNDPDQTNVRSLGSSVSRYASVHAAQFVGEATSALTAITATTATLASSATNASQLNGQTGSYYTNASNLATGTLPDARLPSSVMLKSGSTMTGDLILNGPPAENAQAATKAYVDQFIIRVYESSSFAIANSGTYTLTHALGGVPSFVTVDLINVTAQAGYNPGDIIQIAANADPVGLNEGTSIKKNATNVTIYIGANGPSQTVVGDGSGGSAVLIASSWNMVVRAYR
jgi:hypothetical protein